MLAAPHPRNLVKLRDFPIANVFIVGSNVLSSKIIANDCAHGPESV